MKDKPKKHYVVLARTADGLVVFLDGRRLDPARSVKVWNHADRFDAGYGGSGPAQTALGILLEVADSDEQAVRLHQQFKFEHIGNPDFQKPGLHEFSFDWPWNQKKEVKHD